MSERHQPCSETYSSITTGDPPPSPYLLKLSLLDFCLDIGDFTEAAAVLAEFRRQLPQLHDEALRSALSLAEKRIEDGQELEAIHGKGSLLRTKDAAVQQLISLRLFSDDELRNACRFFESNEG
jgi:hypothetical protein